MEIAQQGYYTNQQGENVDVRESLQRAIQGSQHYHSSYVFAEPKTSTNNGRPLFSKEQQTILICYASSIQAATELVHHYERNDDNSNSATVPAHIGVLSSASAKNPSKFLRGTVSQEEVICRSTLLYPCLAQYEFLPHHFYVVNNKPKYRDTSSACAIFCPRVPVIRRDPDVKGQLLDDYFECSFVSIPAPNAFVLGGQDYDYYDDDNDNEHDTKNDNSDQQQQQQEPTVVPKAQKPGSTDEVEHITLHQALHDRIHRALCMFALNGCTDLVLCAFGCGVHGNSPTTVATIFRQELESPTFRGCFRTVVFAIQPSRTGNYKAFQQVFPDATAV